MQPLSLLVAALLAGDGDGDLFAACVAFSVPESSADLGDPEWGPTGGADGIPGDPAGETGLAGLSGRRGVESTRWENAEVSITFDWGQAMAAAYLQAQTERNRVLVLLPQGKTFQIWRWTRRFFLSLLTA